MVLMAADDSAHHHHHHHHTPKATKAKPAPASESPSPATTPATRTRLHDFTFLPTLSWGTQRLLRCSKDGTPAPASASLPPHPHTPSPPKEKPQGASSQPPRPWNLRTRRSASAAPLAAPGSEKATAQQPLASPTPDARKRVGFSVALTKEEIAEDFLAIRGARPPRRPKKRPRAVQRQIDVLYPGSSLADVTVELYKIDER